MRPSLIVLHYTAMGSAEAALDRLCDPAAEVSCHWLIGEEGRVFALVPEELRAWHAGAGAWGGAGDVNSRSIGIELQNDGRSPFPGAADGGAGGASAGRHGAVGDRTPQA